LTTENRRLESTRAPRSESNFSIRQAQILHQDEIAKMCALLWPETYIEEPRQEIDRLLVSGMYGVLPATILIAMKVHSMVFFRQNCGHTPTDAPHPNPLASSKAGLFTRTSGVRALAKP
jgi:hypothetical protein